MSRPGGLRTYIQEVGSLFLEAQCLLHNSGNVRPQAISREGVGGDVDDSHDVSALAPGQGISVGYGEVGEGLDLLLHTLQLRPLPLRTTRPHVYLPAPDQEMLQ